MADEYKSSGENTDGTGNGFDSPGSSGLRDKQIKRQLSDNTSVWAQLRQATQELNKKNIFEASGETTAKVLRCRKSTKDDFIPSANFLSELFLRDGGADAPSELIQCWCRDELRHSHLPVPSGEDDMPRIMMHQVYTAQTDDFEEPKPKDTVKIDYEDKKNTDRGGILVELVNKKSGAGGAGGDAGKCSGPGAFDQNGATGMTPVGLGGAAVAGTPVDFGQSGPISSKIKAKNAGATALVFGDSQCQGSLGKEIAKYLRDEMGYSLVNTTSAGKFHKSPDRFARHGARPSHFTYEGGGWDSFSKGLLAHLKPYLATKPSLVCFIGGGNGVKTGDATKLVNTIRGIAGNCAILWIGPPTAVPTKNPMGSDEKNTEKWTKISAPGMPSESYIPTSAYKAKRRKLAKQIGNEMEVFPNAIFIDSAALTPVYTAAGGGDGIHMNTTGAGELIKNMKKQGSPAPGGVGFAGIEGYVPNKYIPEGDAVGGFKKGTFSQKKDLLKKYKSEFTVDKAKNFLKDASDRLNVSMQEILGRNYASGFLQQENIIPKFSMPFSEPKDLSACDDIPPNIVDRVNSPTVEWAPPDFTDIGKFYGIQLPPPEGVRALIDDLEFAFGGDTRNAITPEKQYAEQIIEKQKELAQTYVDNPTIINLPGETFPTNSQDIEYLQTDMALKLEAAKEKLQEDLNKKQEQEETGKTAEEQEKPEETTTTTPPSTVGSGCPPGVQGPPGQFGGPFGSWQNPGVDMANFDFKEGDLTPAERVQVMVDIHKKLGMNKYHCAMTFGILSNEGGNILKGGKNRLRPWH